TRDADAASAGATRSLRRLERTRTRLRRMSDGSGSGEETMISARGRRAERSAIERGRIRRPIECLKQTPFAGEGFLINPRLPRTGRPLAGEPKGWLVSLGRGHIPMSTKRSVHVGKYTPGSAYGFVKDRITQRLRCRGGAVSVLAY